MARHDSDKLLANGRFLADKFGVSALRLDTDIGATGEAIPAPSALSIPAASEEVAAPASETVVEREQVH